MPRKARILTIEFFEGEVVMRVMMKKSWVCIVMMAISPAIFAAEWDRQLANPPMLSDDQIVLAEADVIRGPRTVLASETAGQEKDDGLELTPSNMLEYRQYRGDYLTRLYIEKELPIENTAIFLSASKAREFEGLTLGLSYYLTPEISVGMSIGSSRYASSDEETASHHGTVSAFLYGKTDSFEFEVTVERYRRDSDPWYYYMYLQTPVGHGVSLGLFKEKAVGWGPRLSWSPSKNFTFWLSPLIKKEGESNVVFGAQVLF